MTPGAISDDEFKAALAKINNIVTEYGQDSTMFGLETVAIAFAALLDVYAKPNEINPEGMCDDPVAFREHFCGLIMSAGKLPKELSHTPVLPPPMLDIPNGGETSVEFNSKGTLWINIDGVCQFRAQNCKSIETVFNGTLMAKGTFPQ
jgi:hypothetical protein